MKFICYMVLFIAPLFSLFSCSDSPSADADTKSFTITNNTSDSDVQVLFGMQAVLKKGECLELSRHGDFVARIQVSFRPSDIQPSWQESCKQNASQCRFDGGAWWTQCRPGQCQKGDAQHYELKGSSTGDRQWTTTSTQPSSCTARPYTD